MPSSWITAPTAPVLVRKQQSSMKLNTLHCSAKAPVSLKFLTSFLRLSTAADSPDGWRGVLAGVVFGAKGSRHGLDHENQHLGVAAGGQAGQIQQNGEDHDGSQEAAEKHLEAGAGEERG